jgi:hypothetical protein
LWQQTLELLPDRATAIGPAASAESGKQLAACDPPIFGKMHRFAQSARPFQEIHMAEIKRTRRNTLERRCLGKSFKRLFIHAPKSVFKMLEKVKRA